MLPTCQQFDVDNSLVADDVPDFSVGFCLAHGCSTFFWTVNAHLNEWKFQDPKVEVLYRMFGNISWGNSLT